MKRIFIIFGVSIFILLGFFVAKNDIYKKNNEKIKAERWNQQNSRNLTDKNPELLTFIFQPALNHNTEVVLNFEKNYLTFKNIYPFNPEPPPPPKMNGEIINYSVEKPLRPFFVTLTSEEKTVIKNIVNKLSETDYNGIAGPYIDGTSYNFSIVFGRKFKVGYISSEKTLNQSILIEEILNLLDKKNQYEENV